jgi:hypothetical protein
MGFVAGTLAVTEAARQWDDQPAMQKLASSLRKHRPDGASKNGRG